MRLEVFLPFLVSWLFRSVPVLSPRTDFVDEAFLVLLELVLANLQLHEILCSGFVCLLLSVFLLLDSIHLMLLYRILKVTMQHVGEVSLLALDQVAMSECKWLRLGTFIDFILSLPLSLSGIPPHQYVVSFFEVIDHSFV